MRVDGELSHGLSLLVMLINPGRPSVGELGDDKLWRAGGANPNDDIDDAEVDVVLRRWSPCRASRIWASRGAGA